MNPMSSLCVLACLLAVGLASPNHQRGLKSNSLNGYEDPSNWVRPNEIEQLPSLNEVTLQRLEQLGVEEGATLLDQLYHLAQFNRVLKTTYAPEASEIRGYIVKRDGSKVNFNMNNFVQTARSLEEFGKKEVTVFIQGLPEAWAQVSRAARILVQAYQQRYNMKAYDGNTDTDEDRSSETSMRRRQDNDDEDRNERSTGNLVVIKLGDTIENFEQYATLNVQRIGAMIGDRLVQLVDECGVPQEIIHLIGQGPGAHAAGIAGRQFTRQTGHKLRRITGLDPSKLYAKAENTLSGLARGDADFVDAIHTSAYGMGTPERVGDVDFYPNGPNAGVPGADNVVEAAVRATRYFAESVRPGNERNFPAVRASSYKEYKQNNGFGKRTYMGIGTTYDVRGDYILQVNPKSPFGRNTPAQQQTGFHSMHSQWSQQQLQGRF